MSDKNKTDEPKEQAKAETKPANVYQLKKQLVTEKRVYNAGEDFEHDNADVITFLKQNGYI